LFVQIQPKTNVVLNSKINKNKNIFSYFKFQSQFDEYLNCDYFTFTSMTSIKVIQL